MRFSRVAVIALIACCVSSLPLAAQLPSTDVGASAIRRGRYTIMGVVREAEGNRPVENVRVDLHSSTGGSVATTYTNTNGNFAFSDVRDGSYSLVVQEADYEPLREDVNLSRQSQGIQLYLRKPGASRPAPVGEMVSVRALSIPRRAREALERGLSMMHEKSDYRGSLSQFQRAIREYPEYYEAYTQMGVAHMNLGDATQAEQTLQKAIEVSQRADPEAFFTLAGFYSNQDRFAEAEPVAREAVKLAADSWQATHELARALHGLKQETEAESLAKQALAIDPVNQQTLLLLANIYLRMPNYPELIRVLDSYLELAPEGSAAEQARHMREQVLAAMAGIQPRAAPAQPEQPGQ
jgi:cytochrome c-type biogenesis protein CcmH/NrfG